MAVTDASRGSQLLNICGRIYVLTLGACAIVSSVFALFSCQFFSYRTLDGQPWEGFDAPWDDLTEASVGLFSFSELTTSNANVVFGDQCVPYDDWSEAGHNRLFYIAQWCGMAAPVAAVLALVQIVLEMMCCRLRGSFALTSFLFIAATALQGCTFMVFTDSQFCFEAESQNQCTLKTGAWYSLGSTGAYLVLAILAISLPAFPGTEWRCFMCTSGEGGVDRDMDAQRYDDEDTVEKRNGGSETSGHEGTEDSQKNHDQDSHTWDYGYDGYTDATGAMDGVEPLVESNSSGLLSSVKLNETDKFEPVMVLSNVTQEAKPAAVDEEAPAMEEAPSVIKEEEEKNEEKAPEVEDTILADDTIVGILDRNPDFLDVCCGGDPLELEKYLDPKRLSTDVETTPNTEGEAKTDAKVVAQGAFVLED